MAREIGGIDIDQIPDQDIWDIWESIKDGAKTPAESFGFDEPALVAVERMAVGYYRAQKYPVAATIYGFILRMQSNRASAWRGLGACAQAQKEFDLASKCFRQAVAAAPKDLISQVFLGECLCQLGQKDEGIKMLKDLIAKSKPTAAEAAYITRARAIVGAGGGVPSKVVLKRQGKALVEEVEAIFKQDGGGLSEPPQEFDESREIEWEDIKKNPRLTKLIGELKQAVSEGRLSLAEIGGFTENELDGAYAVACKYAEMNQFMQAIQISGYLIFLDPYKGRYYQLVGICLQRMQQYDAAEHYYGMAAAMDPQDPMTKIYRGEAQIMAGKVDAGLKIVKEGLGLAQKDAANNKDLIDRANVLVKQFSA